MNFSEQWRKRGCRLLPLTGCGTRWAAEVFWIVLQTCWEGLHTKVAPAESQRRISGMLGEAGRAVGGNKNFALGGLGALVGSLLGGGGKSLGGALGGA